MKTFYLLKVLIIIFLIVAWINNALAQSCGIRTSEHNINMHLSSETENIDIRTYWYIVRQSDGQGQNSQNLIEDIIDQVVSEFSQFGINLESPCRDEHYIEIISDDLLYNAEVSSMSDDICDFTSYCFTSGLNVFLLDGPASGLAVAPGNLCFAKVDEFNDYWTVAHEIGHCFGLWHTSNGRPYWIPVDTDEEWWECDNQVGITGTPREYFSCDGTTFTDFIPMELVNGSNAEESGDFVVDTPADIDIGFGNCSDLGDCDKDKRCQNQLDSDRRRDPNCDMYSPDWDNFMRFTNNGCTGHFTEGQGKRMMAVIETHLSYIIMDNKRPSFSSEYFNNECPSGNVDLLDFLTVDIPDGAELIVSTDNNPSDGISPILNTTITNSGLYSAYYYYPSSDCFSSRSIPELEVEIQRCCEVTSDLIITNQVFSSFGETYGGNIIIKSGGHLVIEQDHLVYMGEGNNILIEEGGRMTLKEEAQILPCENSWDRIEVYGNLISKGDGNRLSNIKNGVIAHEGSTIELNDIKIIGTGGLDNNKGLQLNGNVNALALNDLSIRNFSVGIEANNSSIYYDFNHGSISNCFIGIKSINTPARIFDYDINVSNRAIESINSPGMLIDNNRLMASPIGDTYGINMWWCDGSIIQNNIIGQNIPLSTPNTGIALYSSSGGSIKAQNRIRAGRTGIFAFGTDFSIIQNDIGVINQNNLNRGALNLMFGTSNQILNNYISARNVSYGVNTVLCNGTQLENNDITTSFSSTFHRAAALKSEGSNNQTIRKNIVRGEQNTNGILTTNGSGSTYDCNDVNISGAQNALSILNNAPGHSVTANRLMANSQDFWLSSVIGPQRHHGNEFIGGNTFAETPFIANDSRFFVNDEYDFHMPENPNPIDWFVNQPDIHNFYECAPGTPGPDWIPFWNEEEILCSYYKTITSTYGYNSGEYIRMIQSILRYSVSRIDYVLPDCITGDPVLLDCWSKLIAVEEMIRFQNIDRSVRATEVSDRIDILNRMVSDDIHNEERIKLKQDVFVLSKSLQSLPREYQDKLNEAENLLKEIDCDDIIIKVSKGILHEYIKLQRHTDRSVFDYRKLTSYSQLCADEYGAYVHLARALVYQNTDEYYDRFDHCKNTELDSRSDASDNFSTIVYPNPSTGLTSVVFKGNIAGTIEAYDLRGHLISRDNFNKSANYYTLNLSDQTGIIMIHVNYTDGSREVFKQIIIQ